MLKGLLPVGSVVLLKGGIKKLVIVGIKQMDEDTGKEYDYIGVLYPEGYLGNDTLYLFNHADINDIIFRGYANPERDDFIRTVEELYAKEGLDG